MIMKNSLFVIILILLICPQVFALEIAYIVADTTSISGDTVFVNRLQNQLGYSVTLLDDNAVDTLSTWSASFDGIVISDLAVSSYVANLKDTVLGVFTMDRYTYDEFGFANQTYRPAGHGRRLVNNRINDFMCEWAVDTIYPYQFNNQYLYYYGDLAGGAQVPFNTPDFVGHDSACVILLDSNAVIIGGGNAAQRRSFCGVFRSPQSMDYCLSWELFDRLATWTFSDTANIWLSEYNCFSGPLEIDACWCEMTSGSNDSATYNSEFRFGYDLDDILSFWRLTEPSRKAPSGYSCDSLQLLFPIVDLGMNGSPPDTIMDLRYTAFKIIKSEKWHGPHPNYGGDPYVLDSTWVTRWDVVSGSAPIAWDSLDLRSEVDYEATSLDTFHLNYPDELVGDTIRFLIPGSVFDFWAADTANNNGLVLKATEIYDTTSNVEYSTRPPVENAISAPMTIQAWFSENDQQVNNSRINIINMGMLGSIRRNIIN